MAKIGKNSRVPFNCDVGTTARHRIGVADWRARRSLNNGGIGRHSRALGENRVKL